MNPRARGLRHERLIFIPVIAAIAAMWLALVWLSLTERDLAVESVRSDLRGTIVTIADFNELAEQATGERIVDASQRRTQAMWRALLEHPAATIWVETADGVSSGTMPTEEWLAEAIAVSDARDDFVIHAAIPTDDALQGWHQRTLRRSWLLVATSAAFLLLTHFLLRALRQRAAAENEAAAAKEREKQLANYKTKLEQTVAQRTAELAESYRRLERELGEREAAETELQQHDALLNAVTKSAAELLGSHSHEQALESVLGLIGQTIGVSRVQINEISTASNGHLLAKIDHEWCAPGVNALIDHASLSTVDLTSELPRAAAALVGGGLASFETRELDDTRRALLEQENVRSVLQLPIQVENRLWGSIEFIDSGAGTREWSWAETDTLETLAGLIGAAMTRARYVKELADANMIVQNSPTILYRVRGEPPFPLMYVSHNITKYGHDPEELTGRRDWAEQLMDGEDEAKLRDAMARTLSKDANGASIELRLNAADGSYRWVENRYTPVRDRQGRLVEIEGMIFDITERKIAEEKIAHLARTDALTGLANRATFIERLNQAFHAAQRGASPFAILYLDLDHFKPINDTLGHPVGDKLLREVANRLRECTRESDAVARLGGDEFAVLQTQINEPAAAGTLAATLQAALMRPFRIDGNDLHITVSIGVCPYDESSASPESMLSQADLALYRSKEEGRNRYRFHSDELDNQVLERVLLSDDLRRAIENDELELQYQPQVKLKSQEIVGMEAFIRWHHPERGLLAASAFLPIAEKTGSIVPLGQWVLDRACAQMRAWRDAGIEPPVVTMNLSLAQLKNSKELVRDVRAALEQWNLQPSDLNFDVTEAMLAQVTLMRSEVLSELRRIGVGISIDNFGSEYSSLDYLRTYHVNCLKITSEFMNGAVSDPERAKVVRAVINFAKELDIGVVTEGVETQEQLDVSSTMSIIAQGLYFSDALDGEQAGEVLQHGRIDPAARPQEGEDADTPHGSDPADQPLRHAPRRQTR